MASKSDPVEGGRSSLQPFSAGVREKADDFHIFIEPHPNQGAFFGVESAKSG
jgi:hypothetical protein